MGLALRALFFSCLVSTFCEHSQAQTRTASGTVTSYSLSLGPISGYNTQGYGFTVYYSTYDGIANNDPLGWSNNWLSYEAMPTTPGLGTYRTDFAIRDSYGNYFNRGTMTFTIPATDSDGNGCPDALQVNKSYSNVGSASSSEYVYNLYGTGNWDSYGTLSPTFTFSRTAGSSIGSVSGSEYDPNTGATSIFSGNFNVEGGTGTATYNPTTKAITFAGNSFSFDASGSGTSTFTRISDNQVSVAQFNFIASDESRTVKAFTLNRTGNYYRAYPVELVDGDPSTSFVDFRYCHVEIYDTNDSDSDGIPDFSDNVYNSPPVAPSALINGLRANLGQFFTYTPLFQNSPTSYSATDLPPGISVNSGSGTISGTPTAAGYYYGLLTANNSSGSDYLDIPITIPGTLQSVPFSDNFSAAVSNRYMPFIFSPLASMSVNNGVLSYTRSSSDDEGATVAWVLNLPLSLSTSWQISTDVTMPSGWSTPFAGVGLTLQPYLSNGTLESVMANRFNFSLGRDTQDQSVNGNYLFL